MSNLPPGVNESMIPGNTPQDMAEDAFWDELDKRFDKENPEFYKTIDALFEREEVEEALIAYVIMARDIGYNAGYSDGDAERSMEQAFEERRDKHGYHPDSPED